MYCSLPDLTHPERLQEYHWKILERQGEASKYSDCDCGPAADSRSLVPGREIAMHLQKYQPVFLELRFVGPHLGHYLRLKLGHRTQLMVDPPDRPSGFQLCPKCCIREPVSYLLQELILGRRRVGRCLPGMSLLDLFID